MYVLVTALRFRMFHTCAKFYDYDVLYAELEKNILVLEHKIQNTFQIKNNPHAKYIYFPNNKKIYILKL